MGCPRGHVWLEQLFGRITLAKLLRMKLGKGYSRPNLNNMRKFYLLYPICQTVSDKLSWSHICELITIDDDLERSFYEKECIASHWNVRSLRRQIKEELKRLVDGIIADTK